MWMDMVLILIAVLPLLVGARSAVEQSEPTIPPLIRPETVRSAEPQF
jgi:hypothetical protein